MDNLNVVEMEELKADLLYRQIELKDLIEQCQDRTQTVMLDQTSVGRVSRVDALQQQSMALANLSLYENQLRQIVIALRKIEDDSYGDCASCEEPIGYQRLKIQPASPLCLKCQSKSEGDH